jgi:hypothetical protein
MPTCENPFDILKCSQICLTLIDWTLKKVI